MRLKFHQTLPSQSEHAPFQAGQIIEIARLTKPMQDWLKRGWVEVLKDTPERAVVTDRAEHAVLGRK